MATMGRYCKAYSIQKLRAFSGWTEKAENARHEKQKDAGGKEIEVARTLTADDYLYMQENYVVTDGVFKDEHIIFDQVTPGWIEYCEQILKFEIPLYEPVKSAPTAE